MMIVISDVIVKKSQKEPVANGSPEARDGDGSSSLQPTIRSTTKKVSHMSRMWRNTT